MTRAFFVLLLAIIVGCAMGHQFGHGSIKMEHGLRQANGTGPAGCLSGSGSAALSNPTFLLAWTVDCTASTIEITMTATGGGWIAFGLGTSMFPSDIYFGVGDAAPTVTDRNSVTYVEPTVDTTQNIIGTPTSVVTGGNTAYTFKRPLDSGDANDKPINAGKLDIVYAFGPIINVPQYHGSSQRAFGTKIDFFAGGNVVGGGGAAGDFRLAHGILMLFSWITVIITTIYLARYMKDLGPVWFRVHQISNWIAVLISIAAWIEIIVNLGRYGTGGHHIIGTIIIGFSIAQPILGTLADKWFDPNRSGTPIFPDRVHNWLGRLILIMTWVQMYLGFCAYGTTIAAWIIYSVWLLLIIIIEILSEILVGGVSHDGAHSGPDETKLFRGKILFGILIFVNVAFFIVTSAVLSTTVVKGQLITCVGY